jgi:hypothetical protein
MATTYPMRKLGHNVTMTITFRLTQEWKVRKWLATQLIKLAALILDCGIEVVNG